MSADNGLEVAKLLDVGGYGVFYWSGDGNSQYHYRRENALPKESHYDDELQKWVVDSRHAYNTPAEAIMAAHLLQYEQRTEYGVSVHFDVLRENLRERMFSIQVRFDDVPGRTQDEALEKLRQALESQPYSWEAFE